MEKSVKVSLYTRFHSRGQHQCKFLRANEAFTQENRIELEHGSSFIVLEPRYGDREVTWKALIY